MLCDICHIREATIKFTQVINKKKKEMHICKKCAEEKGFTNPLIGLQKIFGNLIQLEHLVEASDALTEQASHELHCKTCNLTWQEFQQGGLLGCKDCYVTFEEQLKILLRRIHGSNKHIGNRPPNRRIILEQQADLDKLRRELKIAIKEEKYEQAAILRDRIKDIEANLNRIVK